MPDESYHQTRPIDQTYVLMDPVPTSTMLLARPSYPAVPCDPFEPCAGCGHSARAHQGHGGYLRGCAAMDECLCCNVGTRPCVCAQFTPVRIRD